VRPDLPQPTHWLEEEETLRSILFLRLLSYRFIMNPTPGLLSYTSSLKKEGKTKNIW
jgi:hypothetical protein